MLFLLDKQTYGKHKSLYQLQYIKWDVNTKKHVKTDGKNHKIEIHKIKELENSKINEIKGVLSSWVKEIFNRDIKLYDSETASKVKEKYKTCCEYIINKLLDAKTLRIKHPNDDFFYCGIRHKNDYLNIAIFSLSKEEHGSNSDLYYSVAYPDAHTIREKRTKDTLVSCNLTTNVAIINHIFSHEFIRYIYASTSNNQEKDMLIKLKFEEV